ncbi:MAG: dTDP-4-amino-4,6-dideoxygalactose transaminase [Chloroflexi bacterium]|nr:dTDP-4-amino-4,6-dideoxygalactose transaminase [Chloroflexota bacterium]
MSTNDNILVDFNIPAQTGKELDYIQQAYEKRHISGDGFFTRKCKSILEEMYPGSKALLTTSCTHALEMAALLLDILPGDEVILPSFTFVSTVNAFVLRGARPVFCDIRKDTLNIDESLLTGLISPHTKAIIPVHYAGVGCEMDEITRLAQKHHLHIVEDNAHGLFGKYRSRNLGSFGTFSTLSFHETKNITCGEGGALIINDPDMVTRAEYIREKGTNRSRFFRGMIDKYSWVDIGSSYLPSDILAAILCAQLESSSVIQEKRKSICNTYQANLMDWAESNSVQLPYIPDHCQQPYHMYYMLMPSLDSRQRLISYLRENGIISVFHYLPLHLSDMGQKFGGKVGDCPVTESVSDRLIRLPLHFHLTAEQQQYVISKILAFDI